MANESHYNLNQIDFDPMSHPITTDDSKIKDFLDTNTFSVIKSGFANENTRNFLEESRLDSFIRQISNFPNDSVNFQNKL